MLAYRLKPWSFVTNGRPSRRLAIHPATRSGLLVHIPFEQEWQLCSSRDGIGFENRHRSHDRGTRAASKQKTRLDSTEMAEKQPVRHPRAAATRG